MCVTEKWFYRECGCHYDHSILCSSYRRQRGPIFTSNVQSALDQRPEETGTGTNIHTKQLKHTRPAEPHECPQHTTVEKSFLNQICEDCLLAERHPKAPGGEYPAAPAVPVPAPDNGEGLIWDSEVKVEIQNEGSETPSIPDAPSDTFSDSRWEGGDRRTLKSHVEVEVDSHSLSAEEPSSPVSLYGDDETSSRSSSIPTSPISPMTTDNLDPVAPWYQNKRYGLTLQTPVVADLDDADDESDSSCEQYYRFPSPPTRGRRQVCEDARGTESRTLGPEPTPLPVEETSTSKGDSGPMTFRSSSNNRILSSKKRTERRFDDSKAAPSLAVSLGSTKLKLRNPFRSLQGRKASPLIAETLEAKPVLPADNCTHTTLVPITRPESGRILTLSPHKPNLKNWTIFKFHDRKDNKKSDGSQSQSRPRGLAPGPRESWSCSRLAAQEVMYLQLSDSASEGEAVASAPEIERQIQVIQDHPPVGLAITPNLPQAPRDQPERAVLDGCIKFALGFADGQRPQIQPEFNLAESYNNQHDSAPAWPMYAKFKESEVKRPDSWPLRSEGKKAQTEPSTLVGQAMDTTPADKQFAEESNQTGSRAAEECVRPGLGFTPLLFGPYQGQAGWVPRRPGFPPRKSSLRMIPAA